MSGALLLTVALGILSTICQTSEVHLFIHPLITPTSSQCSHHQPCLTLEQFSINATQYSNTNTSLLLELLPGTHNLSSSIFIHNITHLRVFSQSAKTVNISCGNLANFSLIRIATVELTHLTFDGCGRSKYQYYYQYQSDLVAVLNISSSNLHVRECKFHHSRGIIIAAQKCNIKINKSEFIDSWKVLYAMDCNISDTASYYYGNSASSWNFISVSDTVIELMWGYFNLTSCTIEKNGPFLFAYRTEFIFRSCKLDENIANYYVLRIIHSILTVENSTLCANIGRYSVLYIHHCNMTMNSTTILKNKAKFGPVLRFSRSTLVTYGNITIEGNGIGRKKSPCISFEDSIIKTSIIDRLLFVNNWGFLFISNSVVNFGGILVFLNNSNNYSNSPISSKFNVITIYEGGAIAFAGSTVHFMNPATFIDNYSRNNGGAISATSSKIYVHESITVANNQAQDNGGGIYLYFSSFSCEVSCNFSNNIAHLGGGIHAIGSIILLNRECTTIDCLSTKASFIFSKNYAVRGGGLYFEANSELRGPEEQYQMYEIVFSNNDAHEEGKAIYVDDSTYLETCNRYHVQCFLQTSLPTDPSQDKHITITGKFNVATIFGGFLNRCLVNNAFSDNNLLKGVKYLKVVTRDKNIAQMITSNPISVEHCSRMEPSNYCQPTTSTDQQHKLECRIQRGKKFYIPVIAFDQVGHSVSATISSHITGFPASFLGKNQRSQEISSECTYLTFNVYSSNENEILSISLKNQIGCNSKPITVNITFRDCTCPVGFHVDKHNSTSCECECDPKISLFKEKCNLSIVDKSINGRGWISYDMNTGFLYHPFCPYDFCLPPGEPVKIILDLQNGSDAQCNLNRTGLLCGRCKHGYSLSLSSSQCLLCPGINWPWALLTVIVKLIAGLALVILILVLNLSVSVGTLNGLIFYANILAADTSLFLSFSKPNFHTIFVAWLNLDLGFDVCFKGIDAYSKAWLNISFPIYVIFFVVLIILISKYSSRFGNFIGRWNPVSTLATLLLLSYTKLLRAIITALSFTIITYSTGKQEIVWLQDATVKLFGLKHFPLGLLAIAIIVVGLGYTVLLFFWQWILRLPNRWIFKWARNTRLNLFIAANLAPYRAKYRYWFGLLLFVRMALYLGITTGKSHENVTIVLAIGLIAASILLLRTFLGNNIYRNRFIGYINSSFFYNLLALSLARLYCLNSSTCQKRSSIISIALAFILFVIILSYHILNTLLEIKRFRYLVASIEQILHLRRLKIRLIDDPRFKNVQESELQEAGVTEPTFTEVILSPTKGSSGSKSDGKGANEISRSADEENCHGMESEETVMNDSCSGVGNNDHVCKQKTHQKGKRWTDSNRLREPLLSLQD